jgi:alkaline phosphatase
MRNLLRTTLFFLLLIVMVSGANAQPDSTKNIIVFISDGWGQAQLDAVAYYNGERNSYETDSEWTRLGMSNYMHHLGTESAPYGDPGFVGIHGYDPAQAWSDWWYQQNFATDSAAAATSMATGEKVYKGSICWSVDDQPVQNYFEYAETLGLSTGIVSSVQLSHATPAAYRAHNAARGNYAEIAQELVQNTDLSVVMGCGHPHYDHNGADAPGDPAVPGDWKYVGGYDQWNDLVAGTAGGDRPWTLVEDRADFEALADGTMVFDRVFGCAKVGYTLQHDRDGYPAYNAPEAPYEDPMIATVPTLETMTKAALNVLGQNENGFCIMVEGGAVDWAGHGRAMERHIEEQNDFDAAVEAAIAWVEANSSWDETVMVVTGDHETGFLWGPGIDPSDDTTWFAPIQDNGVGNVPGFYYYSAPNDDWQNPAGSAGHTNQIIPFFVRGAGADYIAAYADETDPFMGDYLDNTELGQACFDMLYYTVPVENPGQPVETPVAQLALDQNYPNPFNPTTTIDFALPRNETVRLDIFDVQGRLVRTLVDGQLAQGAHSVVWTGETNGGGRAASGTYVYRLTTDSRVLSRSMVLVK